MLFSCLCIIQAFGAAMSDPETKLQDSEEIPACKIINKVGLPLVLTPGSYYEVCMFPDYIFRISFLAAARLKGFEHMPTFGPGSLFLQNKLY